MPWQRLHAEHNAHLPKTQHICELLLVTRSPSLLVYNYSFYRLSWIFLLFITLDRLHQQKNLICQARLIGKKSQRRLNRMISHHPLSARRNKVPTKANAVSSPWKSPYYSSSAPAKSIRARQQKGSARRCCALPATYGIHR